MRSTLPGPSNPSTASNGPLATRSPPASAVYDPKNWKSPSAVIPAGEARSVPPSCSDTSPEAAMSGVSSRSENECVKPSTLRVPGSSMRVTSPLPLALSVPSPLGEAPAPMLAPRRMLRKPVTLSVPVSSYPYQTESRPEPVSVAGRSRTVVAFCAGSWMESAPGLSARKVPSSRLPAAGYTLISPVSAVIVPVLIRTDGWPCPKGPAPIWDSSNPLFVPVRTIVPRFSIVPPPPKPREAIPESSASRTSPEAPTSTVPPRRSIKPASAVVPFRVRRRSRSSRPGTANGPPVPPVIVAAPVTSVRPPALNMVPPVHVSVPVRRRLEPAKKPSVMAVSPVTSKGVATSREAPELASRSEATVGELSTVTDALTSITASSPASGAAPVSQLAPSLHVLPSPPPVHTTVCAAAGAASASKTRRAIRAGTRREGRPRYPPLHRSAGGHVTGGQLFLPRWRAGPTFFPPP